MTHTSRTNWLVDAVLWITLLLSCLPLLVLTWGSHPNPLTQFWKYAVAASILPVSVSTLWLNSRAGTRLLYKGVDINDWSWHWPVRLWPVILPFAPLLLRVF